MKLPKKRMLTLMGCALLLAVAAGVVFFFRSRSPSDDYALEKADYPQMASHPKNSTSSQKWDAWQESLLALQPEDGYERGMEGFFQKSIPLFLQSEEGETTLYSPLNVYMALGMLAETTGGESREEILAALGHDSLEDLRTQARKVWEAHYRDDGLVTSILASSLWLDESLPVEEDTLKQLARTYYASSYQGKMGTEKMNRAIGNWIDEQTGGLLSQMTKNISFTPQDVLALVTTVYFKAPWAQEFDPSSTTSGTFYGLEEELPTQMMHDTYTGTYVWGDHFSAVGKALESSGGSMWFVLPDEGITPQQLLEDPRTAAFLSAPQAWPEGKDITVHLTLPRMDISSQTELLDKLEKLGITQVLSPGTADFSPLTSQEGLCLTQAQHGVRVKADEEGVAAAAYTIMAAGAGMPPEDEVEFVLNRPFLFVITSNDGLPLFVGAVYRPS